MPPSPRRALLAAALLGTATAGCASGSFEGGVYRQGEIAYRVGALGFAWRRVRVEGGQLAFHHDKGGTISAIATCAGPDHDAPLDVLTNHLLIGIDQRVEVGRAPATLDGRAALRTRVDGTLDGVPVTLDLVVVKRDGCVYDLQLVTGPTAYDSRRPDFDQFVNGFARVKKGLQ
jgi:hypothetical protein